MTSKSRTLRRYRKRTLVLHWLHTAAFLVLAVTGAVTFFQSGGYSSVYLAKILHRIAAVVFIGIPLIDYVFDSKTAASFIKEAFTWNRDDLKWLAAAPDYYFGGLEERMPPQGRLNAGQKFWQLTVILTGLVFVLSGIILWGFRYDLALMVYNIILTVHGAAFVIVMQVFLVHVYLGVFHPRFKESLPSMLNGKVSEDYAISHYRKWYESRGH